MRCVDTGDRKKAEKENLAMKGTGKWRGVMCMAICSILLLTACGTTPQQLPNTPTGTIDAMPGNIGEEDVSSGYFQEAFRRGEDAVLKKTSSQLVFFDVPRKSGRLLYTLTNPRLVSSTQELPVQDAFLDSGWMPIDEVEGMPYTEDREDYRYPDFIYPDGRFVTGAYYLLIDVSAESDGAEEYTAAELDEGGFSLGQFDDPYIFSMPYILLGNDFDYVEAIWKENGDGTFVLQNPDEYTEAGGVSYFSQKGEALQDSQKEAYYRLEPGQTLTFTIGFAVSEKSHGGWFDMNGFSLYNIMDAGGRLCGMKFNDDGTLYFA